jgi:4a-hydroxytetrahydrobiopterin dehydratase
MERLGNFPGWIYKNNKIIKEFKFDSFMSGINLILKLGVFCYEIDHNLDIHIYYKKILFELQRFSAGGKVTEREFTIARKIDELYSEV